MGREGRRAGVQTACTQLEGLLKLLKLHPAEPSRPQCRVTAGARTLKSRRVGGYATNSRSKFRLGFCEVWGTASCMYLGHAHWVPPGRPCQGVAL